MRNHTTRIVSAFVALLALIGSATIAPAQTLPVPKVVSSSQVDSGPNFQPFLTMTLPAGINPGQLLLATMAIQGSNPLINPWGIIVLPAGGWTELTPNPRNCGGIVMSIAWRIATTSDTQNTQFTWGFISNGYLTPVLASGAIINIANVSTTNPIEQINTNCAVNSSTVVSQPLNTLHTNSMSVLVYGITGDNGLSKPAGYSQVYEHSVFGRGPLIVNDVKVIPVAFTNTGYQDATADLAGDNMGFQLSLAPLGSN